MQLLRSFLFQIWFFVSAVFFAALVVLCAPFRYTTRFAIARGWGHTMLWGGRFFCGLDYVIEGKENIPEDASVIMIKHSTVFETYAQLVTFPPQTWVLKRELQWIPIFGWGLALMKPIAINRSAGRRAVTHWPAVFGFPYFRKVRESLRVTRKNTVSAALLLRLRRDARSCRSHTMRVISGRVVG